MANRKLNVSDYIRKGLIAIGGSILGFMGVVSFASIAYIAGRLVIDWFGYLQGVFG